MTSAEVKATKKAANARIHVERVIRRIKTFKLTSKHSNASPHEQYFVDLLRFSEYGQTYCAKLDQCCCLEIFDLILYNALPYFYLLLFPISYH